jgi:hypothetical protein
MIYSPETEQGIKINSAIYIIYINYMISHLLRKTAYYVCTDPSSSRPTCPFLLVLVHVVSALVEHCLLISLASWGPGPSSPPSSKLTPFPSGPRQRPSYLPYSCCLLFHHLNFSPLPSSSFPSSPFNHFYFSSLL